MTFDHYLPPLRIGAVNYLNTKPLVHGLAELLPQGEVSFDFPSRLADALDRQELDIALVPSIELAEHPEWRIISDACIGCLGPVLSVKLMFHTPPVEVRTLALDEGSRTSAVLAQILLNEQLGLSPQLSSLPIGAAPEEAETDAVLVIGDRAIRNRGPEFVEVWDLGDRWFQWTALPMVFAMWVARPGIASDEAATILSKARDQGCQDLLEIARKESDEMQLPLKLVQEYLCKNLRYYLGSEQIHGLEHFYQCAADLKLIHEPPNIFIDDCPIKN